MAANRCHKLYGSALRADRLYEAAIKKHAGKKVTRWTLSKSQEKIPAIKRAYDRKVKMDFARHRACNPKSAW